MKKNKAPALGEVRIRRIPMSRINPAAYNPRKNLKPGDPEYDALVQSIDTFGYVDPLIWNELSGNLVGGHQRFKVFLARGVKTVDVSVVRLPLPAEKALNLALNKIKGQWDDEGLADLLAELGRDKSLKALGGLGLTGFTEADFQAIVREGDRLVDMLVPREEKSEVGSQKEEDGRKRGGKASGQVYQVVIELTGERAQKNLFERLKKEGFDCKMLVG